jgi:serine O-acetyltransferase
VHRLLATCGEAVAKEAKAMISFAPGERFVRAFYRYHRWRHVPVLAAWFAFCKRFWGVIGGVDIPLTTTIGTGLSLPHPNGIVVHSAAVIGHDCILLQQVTLGSGANVSEAPRLGDGVIVGAGAKIIGGVTIGAGAEIGANAVVVRDVPRDAVVAGVPARIVRRRTNASTLALVATGM